MSDYIPMRVLRRLNTDMDEAFYAASCFAASAHRRTCVIYYARQGAAEAYLVEDAGVPVPPEWTAMYEVRSVPSAD